MVTLGGRDSLSSSSALHLSKAPFVIYLRWGFVAHTFCNGALHAAGLLMSDLSVNMRWSERSRYEKMEQFNCDTIATKPQQTPGNYDLRWLF